MIIVWTKGASNQDVQQFHQRAWNWSGPESVSTPEECLILDRRTLGFVIPERTAAWQLDRRTESSDPRKG